MVSPIYQAACDLLEAIKAEEPHFQQIALDNAKADQEEAFNQKDEGLTTEINRSTSLVNMGDTVDSCTTILKRHPLRF